MSQAEAPVRHVTRSESSDHDAAPRRPRAGAFRRLVGSEIWMVFRRRRNLALLFLISCTPIVIGVAVKVSTPKGGEGPQFLTQIPTNGLFLVFTALAAMLPLLLPVLVGVVAADAIAGEAGTGTLRYLLTIPVSRPRLLVAKAIGVIVFTATAVLAIAVVGIIVGGALFGLHDMTLLSGDTISLTAGLLRTVEVVLYVVATLSGFLAVALFISTLTEVPIGAMAATVGIAIVATVLDALPQLGSLRNLLFTHHWLAFGDILRYDVAWATLLSHLGLQLAYVIIFGAAAWARFTTSDITS
jgi:ABC-2 type transport system permease protein